MLSGFEMKFGRSNGLAPGGRQSCDGRWSVFSGVSPMASRCCSVDLRRESVEEKVMGEDERVENVVVE